MTTGRLDLIKPSQNAAHIRPESGVNRLFRLVALAVLGAALLTISAKIKVPFYPVPMTMQTCVVLLIGAAYGWRLGLATVMLYLAQGAAGLPVFTGTPAQGVGVGYMIGPTGGYLLGFAAAAGFAGFWAERVGRSLAGLAVGLLAADALAFAFGLAWLGTFLGWEKALAGGLYPFLPSELLKVALATALIVGGRAVFDRKN